MEDSQTLRKIAFLGPQLKFAFDLKISKAVRARKFNIANIRRKNKKGRKQRSTAEPEDSEPFFIITGSSDINSKTPDSSLLAISFSGQNVTFCIHCETNMEYKMFKEKLKIYS